MAETTDEDKHLLTYDEAVAMLPEGDDIHTMLNPNASMMIGADWRRDDVLELLKTGTPELGGPGCQAMGHGLVAWRDLHTPIFIQTKE